MDPGNRGGLTVSCSWACHCDAESTRRGKDAGPGGTHSSYAALGYAEEDEVPEAVYGAEVAREVGTVARPGGEEGREQRERADQHC